MTTKRTTHLCCLQCLMLLLASIVLPASAQNNPFKITDSLYTIYQRASRLKGDSACLAVADTLYREAVRLNDKKAQCIALTIPPQHYSLTRDEAGMAVAVERLKEVSRANDYLQYYYFACSQKIIQQLNLRHQMKALEETEQMKKQAFEDNHPYGIYTCIRHLAHIQKSLGNPRLSNQYTLEALDYMLKELPEQDPSALYQDAAEYQKNANNYPAAMEYIEKGIKSAKTERALCECLLTKCKILYNMQRSDEFNACYREAMQLVEKKVYPVDDTAAVFVRILKYLLDRDYPKAHQETKKLVSPVDRLRQQAFIYEQEGRYKEAYLCGVKEKEATDSIRQQLQLSTIAEFNAQIGNERLKLENSRLALQKEEEASRYRQLIGSILILSLLALVAFLIYYLYRRRQHTKHLEEANRELTIARDQAQSANRMKSLFIQNMSHEIRTPLNSIVGFSQLITTPGMELEPEEAQEYSELITTNSELLTTLVNDLLSLSELESGKYVTRLESHSCNELCRQSIATVTHRHPQDVKLYYTSDAPDDYRLLTDGQRVRQVLINFLTNAEKHTEQGEIHLHCSLTEVPGHVTFSVSDTGSGVRPEDAERIFQRFEKLDSFEQGTGLGLNICRLIADYLGGTVRLDTAYTAGARFLFILPTEGKEETKS